MKTIKFLLQKEFLQIFRNKSMLPIMFVMPIIQLLILSNAATYEIKNIKIYLLDKDNSSFSRSLISKFQASPYFKVIGHNTDQNQAESAIKTDKADIIIEIPDKFEKRLYREKIDKVQLRINAVDGSKAAIANAYTNSVIMDFNQEIRSKIGGNNQLQTLPIKQIHISIANWFNPELNYKFFMVPGVLVLLVSMISMFLSSMNLVREKEIGTIEQINVTPIKKWQFVIGKLLPFWFIALFVITIGMIVGKLVFDVPILGSISLLYAFTGIYLTLLLGIGLLISTISNTQQQAMFMAWFFLVIFILMSGLFTAIENMPVWAQRITLFNPIRYFIEFVRLLMLKGAGFSELKEHFLIITIASIFTNTLAILNYRKV